MTDRQRMPKGDGWKTFEEIKTELGRSSGFVRELIHSSMERGDIECFEGRIMSGINGNLVKQVWYREVSK